MNYVSIAEKHFSETAKSSWIDGYARKFAFSLFKNFKQGVITISEGQTSQRFGEESNSLNQKSTSLSAHIHIQHASAYRALLFGGTNGAAEAYIKGTWTTPDLLSVIRLVVRNLEGVNKMDDQRPLLKRMATSLAYMLSANTHRGSRKNIAAHYDLGNEFFKLVLDSTMMYSAAIFPTAQSSLKDASTHKLNVICQKLELGKGDHLLEIGTGWGGLAIHAATHFGCKVTTTTISQKQYDYAKDRIAKLGLDDKITLLFKDYRDLKGKFDKIVSIEMIEAVGHAFYETYFDKCNALLKDDGLMLLQAITICDQRYEQSKNSVDFIKKYIFPGGCLPSNEIIFRHVAAQTNMQVIDLHDITCHYADTLKEWRLNYEQKKREVQKLGYSDAFCRMWEFYLCYSEGGFRERGIGTAQYLLAKPDFRFSDVQRAQGR